MKETSLLKLSIKNAQFYAFHGVKPEETKLGGKFQVDIDLYYKDTNAVMNDDVNYALNYEEALFTIQEVMTEENYNLIETLANEILETLLEKFDELQKATVRVRKLNAPVQYIIDHVEVEQTIERIAK